jgi:hypothetical protein
MTNFRLALFAAVSIAAVAAFASPAAAIEYPWCAEYSGQDAGGGRNCGFVSYAQCMETARGMGSTCEPNLFYKGAGEQPARRVRKRKHD